MPRLLALFSLVLLSGCSSLLFYPSKNLLDSPEVTSYHPTDVYFNTPDGLTLHGWFFRADNKPHGSIFFLHGNAENLSTHIYNVLWLVKAGFNIFIFDYRGYGRSEGRPTLAGVHRDAESAFEALLALPEVDKNRVAILGQSIGGAIAIYAVANSPHRDYVKALIVDSTLSSYRLIAREKLGQVFITRPLKYPLSYLFGDEFSPARWIEKISPIPLLIIHGQHDPVVPAHHSQILYEAALEPKVLWRSILPGHTIAFREEQVRKDLIAFLLDALQHPEPILPVQK